MNSSVGILSGWPGCRHRGGAPRAPEQTSSRRCPDVRWGARRSRSRSATCLSIAAALAILVVVAGCGDGGPKLVPIRGQVTYEGQTLKSGTILYVPRDRAAGRQARGEIQPDGTFQLMTFKPGDGALVGEYDIAIVALDVHPGESREAIEAAGGIVQRGSLIPEKYGDPSTSGLSDSVNADHSGEKRIELNDN